MSITAKSFNHAGLDGLLMWSGGVVRIETTPTMMRKSNLDDERLGGGTKGGTKAFSNRPISVSMRGAVHLSIGFTRPKLLDRSTGQGHKL